MGWGDTLKAEQTIELTVTGDEGSVDTETRTVRVVRPERKYYVTDHLGSVRVVMDDSANVEETRDYYPFGLPMPGRYDKGSPPTKEDFTGHVKDGETGRHYAGARYYSAAFGRWMTTDPILGEKGPKALLKQDARLLTMSSYNYAFGSPTTLTDPTGLAPMDWYRDEEGNIVHDEDVQSRADLKEGQTYLGESVLVKTKQGGTQLLSEGGKIRNVYEGDTSLEEGVAWGLSGVGAAAGKQESTLRMAGEMGETLAKRNVVAGAVLSGGSFVFSGFSVAESESTVYRRTRLAADAALAGLSTIGGPYGAIGSFALDMTVKDSAVEWVTNEILKRSVDRVLTWKKRVDPK